MSSPTITVEQVKELRAKTGAGVLDCKKALVEANGDIEKAVELLRKKGAASADGRADRTAREGMIASYLHTRSEGGVPSIGVLLEVNSESDFAARSDVFKDFVNKLCLHIAAASPRWLRPEDVPEEVIEKEKEILRAQLANVKKPPEIIERIVEGRLRKFYDENCLMNQVYALAQEKSQQITIEQMLKEVTAKIGEKIEIRRFCRYELGQS